MRLDLDTLEAGCHHLATRDEALAALFARNGVPPLWDRRPGFETLVKLVLEQQVSLASGAAAYRRLEERLGSVSPESFLTLDDAELRTAGFSRQKTRYVRLLSQALVDRHLALDALSSMSDEDATVELTKLIGIGPWTAGTYLLFALGRPDVWPSGDRALVVAMRGALDMELVPSYVEADEIAERWRPWRSVAARMLWHEYLGGSAYDPATFS